MRLRYKSTHGVVRASSKRAVTQRILNVLPQPSGNCVEASFGRGGKALQLPRNARNVFVGRRLLKFVFRCACLSFLYFPDNVGVGSMGAV